MNHLAHFFHRSALLLLAGILLPLLLSAQAWQARHGLSADQYQTEFNTWKDKGYRPVLISGYADNNQERYIGIWEKKSGAAWAARHAMNAAQYQAAFDELSKDGYRPRNISAFTVGATPRFAGIWDKSAGPEWAARHNMNETQYQAAVNDFKKKGMHPVQVCGYTINGVVHFAALWEKSNLVWEARHNLTAAEYQSTFNTLTSAGYTPVCVNGYMRNGVEMFTAVWEKKPSLPWEARHSISAQNYQPVFDNMLYTGYRPRWLSAHATGVNVQFNGIWEGTPFSGTERSIIDKAVGDYMSTQDVKGLSLAVSYKGRLVFAKGYGYANPASNLLMSPSFPLRIMSISKSVTATGIMLLVQKNKLNLNKKVFGPNSILGSTYATPANLKKIENFNVRQLLWHTSGLRTCNGEPEFWDKNKSADDAMKALLGYSNLMKTDADVEYEYSNTGYFILGRIIEKVSGESYESFIRKNVLTPAGIGNTMYVGKASGDPQGGEGSYTPMTNMNLQLWGPFGGWVARPLDLLKFLNAVDGRIPPADIMAAATHDTMTTGSALRMGYAMGWGVSGNEQNHNGCHGSSRSFLVEMPDNLSFSVIINSTPTDDGCGWKMRDAIEPALKKISWPDYNLF